MHVRSSDLFNGELFPSDVSHLGDGLNVLFQTHLQALGEGESGLGDDGYTQFLRKLLPMSAHNKVNSITINKQCGIIMGQS